MHLCSEFCKVYMLREDKGQFMKNKKSRLFVTLDHKTSLKCKLFKIDIYT